MDKDIIVIGAGAAGLAAARALHDAGRKVIVLEARDRLGGRACTDDTLADFPIELGAEFIHGENASTHALVNAYGMHTIPSLRLDARYAHWYRQGDQLYPMNALPKSIATQWAALQARYAALGASIDEHNDVSLADYLGLARLDEEAYGMAEALFAQTCCAPLHSLSSADLAAEMRRDTAGKLEYRVAEGYSALFARYARGLDVRYDCPVKKIAWRDDGVDVTTANDEVYSASACVITIPVAVLQSGGIQFVPSLSTRKLRALWAFRVEPATKIIHLFSKPIWQEDVRLIAHALPRLGRWWVSSEGREGKMPVITQYLTAEPARHSDSLPPEQALEESLRTLLETLGIYYADAEKHLASANLVRWSHDIYAQGGYAHVLPGHADARHALAAREGCLFFAGEATAYDSNPQTVHGALDSGVRAAREILSMG
jgi:monoamine oxidase